LKAHSLLVTSALALFSSFLLASPASAAVQGYYRFPTIHGDDIVFACEGDLWKVSTKGGEAMRLTSHPGVETMPHFSPDGKWIAFTADYSSSGDVYVMPADGGEPRQLSFHPAQDLVVGWTPDSNSILFRSRRSGLDAQETLFKVPRTGGEPEVVKVGAAAFASFAPDGNRIVFNRHSWGGNWKRYRGGTAPDVWVGDLSSGKFSQIIPGDFVNQFPMWVGDRIFFASERAGVGNLFSCATDGSNIQQVTQHADFDARYPDTDGKKIVYSVGADLWVYDIASKHDDRVDVQLPSDRIRERPRVEDASKTVDAFDLSPDGKRLAVSSRGEIWVTNTHPGNRIVQLTNDGSASRERLASFSPDGKKLIAITDETGEQELVIYDAKGKEPRKILTHRNQGWLFQPLWAAGGRRIVYADLTGTLLLADAETGEIKEIDHDDNWEIREYDVSPNGEWVVYAKTADNLNPGLWLYNISSGKKQPISNGFTSDYSPSFSPDGKYLLFLSNRHFNPYLDEIDNTWLNAKTTKPCLLILAKDGKSPFLPEDLQDEDKDKDKDKEKDKDVTTKPSDATTKETAATKEADEKDAKDKKDSDAKEAKESNEALGAAADKFAEKQKEKAKDADASKKLPKMKVDLEEIDRRVIELPNVEGDDYRQLAAGDGKVFFMVHPLQGMAEERPPFGTEDARGGKLLCYDLKKKKLDTFIDGLRSYTLSRDAKRIAWRKGKELFVADAGAKPGNEIEEKLALNSLPLSIDPQKEWVQIFTEAWRLQRDFYWAENMAGIDWPEMRSKYQSLIPRVGTRGELNDLIGQLIGELGTSHTYIMGGDSPFPPPDPVAVGLLGADVQLDAQTKLHQFVKVLRPETWETDIESPLSPNHVNVREGDYLLAINGRELKADEGVDERLANLAGVQVLLTVCSKPDKSDQRDVEVKTIKGSDQDLRYADWCRRNREYVAEKSSGRIGYFHLPDMQGDGLVKFTKGFFPQYDKDALLIDVRNNHGGFVSQMLIERLNRKVISYSRPRRGKIETYPGRVHVGPKAVLINQHAGSDGDIFPDSFRALGLGPLIGRRTWGGVIGIRMDKRFVDGGVSSQPEFAWWEAKRGWGIENQGVAPDIEVDVRPEDYIAGRDPQMDRGIQELLKALEKNPVKKPEPPAWPDKSLRAMQAAQKQQKQPSNGQPQPQDKPTKPDTGAGATGGGG
jgi:tricorn protease